MIALLFAALIVCLILAGIGRRGGSTWRWPHGATDRSAQPGTRASAAAGYQAKPRINIHKSATENSDEAFFQEVGRLRDFIESHQAAVLNVAGPRESNQPGVYAFALENTSTILGDH